MLQSRATILQKRNHSLRIAFLALLLLLASDADGASQELPQQMGAINDYAVALGGKAQREPLEALLVQLNREHQVTLVILLSERAPYSDLERYGIEVQRAWNLPQQRQAALHQLARRAEVQKLAARGDADRHRDRAHPDDLRHRPLAGRQLLPDFIQIIVSITDDL